MALHDAATTTLVTKHPFQLAYVTNDLEQAIEQYATLLNAPDFARLESRREWQMADGVHEVDMAVALAWVGDITVELIQPLGGRDAIYRDVLDGTGFQLRFHHFGYRLDGDAADVAAFRNAIPAELLKMEKVEPSSHIFYLDTRAQLGHYLEYLWWAPEASSFIEGLPRN